MQILSYVAISLVFLGIGMVLECKIGNGIKGYRRNQELKEVSVFNIDKVKKITQETTIEQAEKQLIRIQENIIEEAKKGKTFLNYHNFIYDSTKDKLKEMGFTLSDETSYIGSDYIIISWDNKESKKNNDK